jgi:phosphoribosyl-AMP cyclohydrolase / phosphoribosyl-ATP pyrophosphohydrolase
VTQTASAELRPVVVQDADDGTLLMLAWANAEALAATRRTGGAHFWSRSRGELWHKGATSGNRMAVVEVATDCDGDALLYRVRPAGPACHTGARSCFGSASPMTLAGLERTIAQRASASPAESYTARLLAAAPGAPAAKLVEEAGEASAAALAETPQRLAEEAADVVYHLLVLLRARGVSLDDVLARLAERRR